MILGYLGWAGILFAQNYSFTYVSRARNSGSLLRHFKAAVFSNAVWILSQILMLGPMFSYLTGKYGIAQQLVSGVVYTAATVAGSLAAHYVAKRTEKGMERVGASKDVATFTQAEAAALRALIVPYQHSYSVQSTKGVSY